MTKVCHTAVDFLYTDPMLGAPIWLIIACVGIVASALVALVLHVLRKLVTVVDNLGRVVEHATSDQATTAHMMALSDRLEACEQRSRSALAQTSDAVSQFDRLEDRLKSHIARSNAERREYKSQGDEEAESKEIAEFMAAAQAVPVEESDDHPSNNRRRRRRRRRSE